MKIIFLLIIFTILNFVGMSQVKENNVMEVSNNTKHYLSDDYLVADRSFNKRDNKKTKPSDKSNNEDKKKVSDNTKHDTNKTKTNLNKVDSNTNKVVSNTDKVVSNIDKVNSNTNKVVSNIVKVDSNTDKAVSDTDKKKQKSVHEKTVEQDSYKKEEVDNDNVSEDEISEDENYNVSDDSSDDDTIGIEMGPFSVLIGGTYLPITNDATQARIDRADQELVNWGSNYTPSKTIGDGSSLYLAVESSGYGSLMYSNPQSITFSDSNNDVSEYNLVGVHGPYNYKRYFDDNWVSAVRGEQGEAIFIQTCISADSSYKIWEYRR